MTGNNFFSTMGGKKKLNGWSNTGNQDKNYIQTEPPDPPDRATQSRMRTKTEGANKHTMQTNDTHSPSTEQSKARTISEVEEIPK